MVRVLSEPGARAAGSLRGPRAAGFSPSRVLAEARGRATGALFKRSSSPGRRTSTRMGCDRQPRQATRVHRVTRARLSAGPESAGLATRHPGDTTSSAAQPWHLVRRIGGDQAPAPVDLAPLERNRLDRSLPLDPCSQPPTARAPGWTSTAEKGPAPPSATTIPPFPRSTAAMPAIAWSAERPVVTLGASPSGCPHSNNRPKSLPTSAAGPCSSHARRPSRDPRPLATTKRCDEPR